MKKHHKNLVWLPEFLDKIRGKHGVEEHEVEEVFLNKPKIQFWETGDVPGEDFYQGLGRSDDGRYLVVFFIQKLSGELLIISTRDMDKKEKKRYGKK